MVDEKVFTRNGSAYFKRTIREKEAEIQDYNIAELKMEQRALENRKFQMNEHLSQGGIFSMFNHTEFTEHQKGIYTMYRDDISELLTQVKNRLLELEGAQGMRKRKEKTKSRRKNKGKRKMTKRRKAYTRSN